MGQPDRALTLPALTGVTDPTAAQYETTRRAVAKLTTSAEGGLRFRDDPPLLVHLEDTGHVMAEVAPMIEQFRSRKR